MTLISALFVAANVCDPVFLLLSDEQYQSHKTIGNGVILADWLNEEIKPDLQQKCFPFLQSMSTSGFNGACRIACVYHENNG